MSKPLKLIVQSEKDLQIISSALQDMTVRIGDMAWLKAEQRFALVGNRFRWEKKGWFRRPKGERIRTAFHLNGITAAKLHQIDLTNSDTVLDLLTLTATKQEKGVSVQLVFAGGAAIHLSTDALDGLVTDIGESWDAIERPRHQLDTENFG
jgi:Protein of unknown function (DUF2948)